ncbi:hypothetical protein RF55_19788 [Lasius niger]|uniref:Uncharacterized protein n=1 Tax=Lasius niger TaxID=67767 RepID=A0A0J7JZB0_LASNI|nr:hypothetical protein RF55_19788 [Lasius niger]
MGDQPDKPKESLPVADKEMETNQEPGEQEPIPVFDPVMAGKVIRMEEVIAWIEPVEEAPQQSADATQITEDGANTKED